MIIIDTSVLIDHIRTQKSTSFLMDLYQSEKVKNLAISVVTIQELYEGKSTQERSKEEKMLALISPLQIFPYTYDIAVLAGKVARDKKDVMDFPDSVIAATSLFHHATLATLNTKDFAGILGLELYTFRGR